MSGKDNKTISSRSPLRYPGGKSRAREILMSYIPENVSSVLSPFLGGGSFELHLTGKGIDVESYDVFALLVNFWQVLLSSPDSFGKKLDDMLGKIGKSEFDDLKGNLKSQELSLSENWKDYTDEDNTIAREKRESLAAEFFAVNRCSFSGATLSGGFSKESARTRFTSGIVERVRTFSNDMMTVGYGDVFDLLDEGSCVDRCDMMFLDPPYMLEYSKNKLYGIDGNLHFGFDHGKLASMLKDIGKPFVLTYNDCDHIRELYSWCDIHEETWSYGMSVEKAAKEIVIVNKTNRIYNLR